jgi:hypothetical protein
MESRFIEAALWYFAAAALAGLAAVTSFAAASQIAKGRR